MTITVTRVDGCGRPKATCAPGDCVYVLQGDDWRHATVESVNGRWASLQLDGEAGLRVRPTSSVVPA
jgi:hypothetical protein